MSNIHMISDLHLGHRGVTQFLNADGSKLRPWSSVEEMDEAIVENWNSVVRPKDKVYNLGDVVINRRALATLGRLNGEKILIKGNHDMFRLEEYTPYFKDVRGVGTLDKYVLTHIPIHPSSLGRWDANIHGHLHSNVVIGGVSVTITKEFGVVKTPVPDTRYFSVCCEQPYMNYTPIPFETVKAMIKESQR